MVLWSIGFTEPVPKPIHCVPSLRNGGNQESLVGGVGTIGKRGCLSACIGADFKDNVIINVNAFKTCGLVDDVMQCDTVIGRKFEIPDGDLFISPCIEGYMIDTDRWFHGYVPAFNKYWEAKKESFNCSEKRLLSIVYYTTFKRFFQVLWNNSGAFPGFARTRLFNVLFRTSGVFLL